MTIKELKQAKKDWEKAILLNYVLPILLSVGIIIALIFNGITEAVSTLHFTVSFVAILLLIGLKCFLRIRRTALRCPHCSYLIASLSDNPIIISSGNCPDCGERILDKAAD